MCAWVAGSDVSTGDLITAATWNNYLGTGGDIDQLLRLSGGTMTGDIAMSGTQKLTGLAAGSAAGESVRYEQIESKELYIPATQGTNGIEGEGNVPGVYLNAALDEVRVSFKCPDDFGTLVKAYLLVIPAVTQAVADWDIFSDYGAVGEAFNTHSETDAATTYNVTQWQLFEVDVSGILTALAASDIGGIRMRLANAAHDVMVIGLYIVYTIA